MARGSRKKRPKDWNDRFFELTQDMSSFLRGLDENGGLAALDQRWGWTLERKREWLEQAVEMQRRWAMFVVELQRECQHQLKLVHAGPAPFLDTGAG
jgi:hypothetical protein